MVFDYKNASPAELKNEYNRIAKEIGDDQFFTKRELSHLPKILGDGEQVLAFTSGLMDGNTWLITLTDRRIIFLDKGLIYGLKQVTIDLDKINAVSGRPGFCLGLSALRMARLSEASAMSGRKLLLSLLTKLAMPLSYVSIPSIKWLM